MKELRNSVNYMNTSPLGAIFMNHLFSGTFGSLVVRRLGFIGFADRFACLSVVFCPDVMRGH